MKKIIAILSVLLFTMALGCDEDSDDATSFKYKSSSGQCRLLVEGEVYMGALLSEGGDVWPVPELVDIAKIAVDEINENGGIHGKTLGCIVCDSQCLPEMGDKSMRELLNAKADNGIDISVIVGPSCSYVATMSDGTAGTELFKLAHQNKVPLVAPSTESAALTNADDGGYFFRTIGAGSLLGTVQGTYLANDKNLDRVSLIYDNDSWGGGMAAQVRDSFAAARGVSDADTIVNMIPFCKSNIGQDVTDATKGECSDEVVAAHNKDPLAAADAFTQATGNDGIFFLGYDSDETFTGLFKSQLSSYAWSNGTPHLELSNGLTEQIFKDAQNSELMTGMGGITPQTPDTAAAKHFADSLMKRAGKEVGAYYATTYDAFKMAATGMALADDPNNGEQVQAGLSNDSHQGAKVSVGDWAKILSEISANGKVDVDGASGPINFDANGDVLSRFTRQQFNSEGKYEASGCWEGDGTVCAD